MAKLHELLAVLGEAQKASSAILAETHTTFTKRPDHFLGMTKRVDYFDEDRAETENTVEVKNVVTTVDQKLDHTIRIVARHWDAVFQMEKTNQKAVATLKIGPHTFEDVPATFLLGMETRLIAFRELIQAIPTLAPELTWDADGVSQPLENFKTEKTLNHRVLYDATDKHPAQIEKWNEDRPVAKITTVHQSGMISPARKSQMMSRVDDLIVAVKAARQRANMVEVETGEIADALMRFVTEVP